MFCKAGHHRPRPPAILDAAVGLPTSSNPLRGGKLSAMAAKKKAKKKKKTPARKVRTARGTQKKSTQKKSAQKKASPRKMAAKRAAKPAARLSPPRKRTRAEKRRPDLTFSGSRSAGALSADTDSQGLSDVERADSESVAELLEEGNTLEAGVVRGVEQAEDADESEVRTREFPEDDVPEEYLDKD